ncbi:hypothetical protein FIBSPDRAFT_963609 [Athelia psychrophila]|uniref:Uncharacterized protein n=1 Tax=Athelia psychrophila TaxID=1759441 RepID=A0A165YRN5_9AGAM|nr:hypothetical protein FIBSPDRAFT_963609 [Fibularhizoctonia sp. CBS 109695]
MKPTIQDQLNNLVAAQGASSTQACFAAVFIITLDLSFFIWDKNINSTKCFSQALSIYKEAAINHEAVMKAVGAACRMEKGDSDKEEAFRARMTDIVLTHRLSESYRVETGRG